MSNQIKLNYRYTNIGFATASNLNIDATQLPMGYKVDATSTCPLGTTVSSLSPNASCTVVLLAVESNVQGAFHPTGAMNLNALGFSYFDSNTGINQVVAPANGLVSYVNANLWASVTPTVINVNPVAGTYSINLLFTASGISTGLNGYSIIVSPQLSTNVFSLSSPTCTITAPATSCLITATTNILSAGNYNFGFTYQNTRDSNTIKGYIPMTLN